MVEHHPDAIARQLCLVVTRTSNKPGSILKTLEHWFRDEFSDETQPCNKRIQRIQRILSFLIQTPESILCVDVTTPGDTQALLNKLASMPIHNTIQQYSFASNSMEIALIQTVIHAVLGVKEEVQFDIAVLQSTLKAQLKHQLLPLTVQAPEALDECKQTLLQLSQTKVGKAAETAETIEETIDVIVSGIEQLQRLSHRLQTTINTTYAGIGCTPHVMDIDESIPQTLLQKQTDLNKHQAFFDAFEQLRALTQQRHWIPNQESVFSGLNHHSIFTTGETSKTEQTSTQNLDIKPPEKKAFP